MAHNPDDTGEDMSKAERDAEILEQWKEKKTVLVASLHNMGPGPDRCRLVHDIRDLNVRIDEAEGR